MLYICRVGVSCVFTHRPVDLIHVIDGHISVTILMGSCSYTADLMGVLCLVPTALLSTDSLRLGGVEAAADGVHGPRLRGEIKSRVFVYTRACMHASL